MQRSELDLEKRKEIYRLGLMENFLTTNGITKYDLETVLHLFYRIGRKNDDNLIWIDGDKPYYLFFIWF